LASSWRRACGRIQSYATGAGVVAPARGPDLHGPDDGNEVGRRDGDGGAEAGRISVLVGCSRLRGRAVARGSGRCGYLCRSGASPRMAAKDYAADRILAAPSRRRVCALSQADKRATLRAWFSRARPTSAASPITAVIASSRTGGLSKKPNPILSITLRWFRPAARDRRAPRPDPVSLVISHSCPHRPRTWRERGGPQIQTCPGRPPQAGPAFWR
jgi:hypothetical protein